MRAFTAIGALLLAECLSAGPLLAADTVVALQPWRTSQAVALRLADGTAASATLTDLNPAVGRWYLLTLRGAQQATGEHYHLEVAPGPSGAMMPARAQLQAGADGTTLDLLSRGYRCEVWSAQASELKAARQDGLPYAPLCGGRWYLRNPVVGRYTALERVTELLREHVWGGDQIVNFVREHAFRDAFAQTARVQQQGALPLPPGAGPLPAQLASEQHGLALEAAHLGIALSGADSTLQMGGWYAVANVEGVYVSVIRPSAIPQALLRGDRCCVNTLDATESNAVDYLVAMDMRELDLHYAIGTEEPRVGWSERVLPRWRSVSAPGPDGFDVIAPLVGNGMIAPPMDARVVVTFAGGFKREHGAFRYGALAQQNNGSHYGFMQQGVLLSSLQPGLATVYTRRDGGVAMGTWRRSYDSLVLPDVVDARQNGVPLIDYDPLTARSFAGRLVNRWGEGNWSGSSERQLRTLRAGLCEQRDGQAQFLIFGYFSTATPSAMVRVFQAYGCRYALQLDINALEHTYFALYAHRSGQLLVEHLIDDMAVVDRKGPGGPAPRFLAFPDDRDFFYLTRRVSP